MQFVMRKEGRGEPLICGAALGGKGKGGCHQLGRRGDKEERGQARRNIGLNDTKCHCVSFLGRRIAQSSFFFFFSLLGRETECQLFFGRSIVLFVGKRGVCCWREGSGGWKKRVFWERHPSRRSFPPGLCVGVWMGGWVG